MKRVLVGEADSSRPLKLRTNQKDLDSDPCLLDSDVTVSVDVDVDVDIDVGLGYCEVCFGMVCTMQEIFAGYLLKNLEIVGRPTVQITGTIFPVIISTLRHDRTGWFHPFTSKHN
jgi:hypothetical protein